MITIKKFLYLWFVISVIQFSCGKKESVSDSEKLKNLIISEGKKMAKPEEGLISSKIVQLILRDYLKNITDIYYYEGLTEERINLDLNSFFVNENIYLLPFNCEKNITCPKIKCNISENKSEVEVEGNCFNDFFVFLGKSKFSSKSEKSNYLLEFEYKAEFQNWEIKIIGKEEYIDYTGNVTFSLSRSSDNFKAQRSINLDGIVNSEFFGYSGLKFLQSFDHRSFASSGTKSITQKLYEYKNPFCFIIISDERYPKFACSRDFTAREISIYENRKDEENIVLEISGKEFDTFNIGGELRWVSTEQNIKIEFNQKKCIKIDGNLKISSEEEELNSIFVQKTFEDRECDLTCPSKWEYKVKGKTYQGTGCIFEK